MKRRVDQKTAGELSARTVLDGNVLDKKTQIITMDKEGRCLQRAGASRGVKGPARAAALPLSQRCRAATGVGTVLGGSDGLVAAAVAFPNTWFLKSPLGDDFRSVGQPPSEGAGELAQVTQSGPSRPHAGNSVFAQGRGGRKPRPSSGTGRAGGCCASCPTGPRGSAGERDRPGHPGSIPRLRCEIRRGRAARSRRGK